MSLAEGLMWKILTWLSTTICLIVLKTTCIELEELEELGPRVWHIPSLPGRSSVLLQTLSKFSKSQTKRCLNSSRAWKRWQLIWRLTTIDTESGEIPEVVEAEEDLAHHSLSLKPLSLLVHQTSLRFLKSHQWWPLRMYQFKLSLKIKRILQWTQMRKCLSIKWIRETRRALQRKSQRNSLIKTWSKSYMAPWETNRDCKTLRLSWHTNIQDFLRCLNHLRLLSTPRLKISKGMLRLKTPEITIKLRNQWAISEAILICNYKINNLYLKW